MQKVSGIIMPLGHSKEELDQEIFKRCGMRQGRIVLLKKSIDARRGTVQFVYSAAVYDENETIEKRAMPEIPVISVGKRPVVIGCGPAGLFAAYILAKAGCRPIVLERGKDAQVRQKDVMRFWETGILNEQSNVQFGEGGAGTFSDGKLTTGISDPLQHAVIELFLECGAPEEIGYLSKPHIGTDKLIGVVQNLREKIEQLGGEVVFERCVTDFVIQNGEITGVVADRLYETDCVILAIGHSARDTIKVLHEKGFSMEQKPFSVGVRIEHPQEVINRAQYGKFASHPDLPPAEYKLSYHTASGLGVYTFCMCPGGTVVAAASEAGGVVTNGMSYHDRSGKNANAALLVSVRPTDLDNSYLFAGIDLQKKLEQAAFVACGRNFKAPAQYAGSFLRKKVTGEIVNPTYQIGIEEYDLKRLLPSFVCDAMQEALPVLGRKLKGFDMPGALLTAPETRSSSPVRVLRNAVHMSNITGVFPAGEGAGYAGGIVSAAVDGMKCALSAIFYLKDGKVAGK